MSSGTTVHSATVPVQAAAVCPLPRQEPHAVRSLRREGSIADAGSDGSSVGLQDGYIAPSGSAAMREGRGASARHVSS